MKRLIPLFLFILLALPAHAQAPQLSFDQWLRMFQQQAIARGIRPQTAYTALSNVYLDEGIIEKDQTQPEHTVTAVDYWKRVVSERRITRGKTFLNANRELLKRVSDSYGVEPKYIVALLGVESDYGDLQGHNSIIQSLATLAYEGRRADFFANELFNALRIVDAGHVLRAEDLTGSWAGAMGYCQFMPTSFFKYGQDFDGDGRIDIWNSVDDAAASTANYLHANGWVPGQGWGRRVTMTKPIDENLAGLKTALSFKEWAGMGVRLASGKALPKSDMRVSLVVPDGGEGAAFLVGSNFNVIMQWNRSTYFATSVGLLADAVGK